MSLTESALWSIVLRKLAERGLVKSRVAKVIPTKPLYGPAPLSPFINTIRSAFPALSTNLSAQPARQAYAYVGVFIRPNVTGAGFRRSFFNHAGRPQFSSYQRPAFGARRNFSTGHFTPSPQQAADSLGTFLNGGKVFAAAVTEKRKMAEDEMLSDDLKERLQARAAAKRTKISMQQKRSLLQKLPAGTAQPEVEATAVPASVEKGLEATVEKKQEEKSDAFMGFESKAAFGLNDHVRMSIYLYAPPTWELESLQPNPRATIRPATIAELRRIANIHHNHLLAVADILESLMNRGVNVLEVTEEEGGLMEIGVHFKPGASPERVRQWLDSIGVSASSEDEHFRLEVVKGVVESVESLVMGSDRKDIEDFLALVDSLISEDREFGVRSSQRF
ncbi:hypothetical protein HK097_003444 [Rhizophlyctis rosea]|uniref:Uncharacterized protein n=1 Tax=Rhizophlyctis rosea TaxID=64517 RepID=A0AAD5X672_9FUNG|nr:hypothetical protein HK097_003444 [Rhizophlyctis rosea]